MVVNERRRPDGSVELIVEKGAEGYVVRAPFVGAFHIDARGALKAQEPEPSISEAEVKLYFTQQIEPLLAQLRGTPHLHGSAVDLDGRAVGFLGRSGYGKSTLAASLTATGGRLLGDDAIAITLRAADEAWCTPTGASVRLRDDSLAAVPLGGATRPSFGKTELLVDGADGGARLARLYVLDPTPTSSASSSEQCPEAPSASSSARGPGAPSASEGALEVLRARDALVALAANAHRLDPTDKTLLTEEVGFFERVARAVPMRRLQVPRDFSKLADVKRRILFDLAR